MSALQQVTLVELRAHASSYTRANWGPDSWELSMKTTLLICVTLASVNFAMAQTPPPQSTAPSSASSPHQREATSTATKEAPAPSNAAPSAASSPHQQQVTQGADKTKAQDKMMKDCMAKLQSTNSSMSQEAAKKTCTDQVKTKAGSEQK
jgi:hypothetical protein